MLTNYGVNENITAYLDAYDFYIFPIVNPDGMTYDLLCATQAEVSLGFVFTQTEDRLWRKNRQPTMGSTCVGTDNNRNWPYQWNATEGAGSSANPCSATFRGTLNIADI